MLHNRSQEKAKAWQHGIKAAMNYHSKAIDSNNYRNFLLLNRFSMQIDNYIVKGRHDSDKMSVLDLGCGTGAISLILNSFGINTVGIDVSKDMLSVLREEIPDQPLVRGSVFDLPFADASFDAVVSRIVITHFPDWLRILIGLNRIMKKDGILIFDLGNAENLHIAKKLGAVNEKNIGLSSDPKDVNFSVLYPSRKLIKLLTELGFAVLSIAPCDLIVENYVILQIVGEKYKEYIDKIQELFNTKTGREFLMWIDSQITMDIPLEYTRRMIIVAKKI